MKCKLIRPMMSSRRPGEWDLPGEIIEHPKCWMMVMMGCAVPADDQCEDRCNAAGLTSEAFERAKYAYERQERGIAPEDWPAYDAGAMTGYDEDGEWIPGPNYDSWMREHDEEEDE